ncbi:hypothetical protein [Xanthomonas campestris]|nr:hypothetical protein [Xanthomonas campestris]
MIEAATLQRLVGARGERAQVVGIQGAQGWLGHTGSIGVARQCAILPQSL